MAPSPRRSARSPVGLLETRQADQSSSIGPLAAVNQRRTEQRLFLRDLALLLGVPATLLVLLVVWWKPWLAIVEPYTAPDGDVFAAAAGTWDWDGAERFCEKNPHTISFSADRGLMTLVSREPWTDSSGTVHQRAEYDVLGHTAGRIRGRIRGETRMTADGQPVVWDLVLVDANTYRWHRTDWPLVGFTGAIRRCGAVSPSR
jgi:hypothetical protein